MGVLCTGFPTSVRGLTDTSLLPFMARLDFNCVRSFACFKRATYCNASMRHRRFGTRCAQVTTLVTAQETARTMRLTGDCLVGVSVMSNPRALHGAWQ